MIITRTPLRVSWVGGGSDLPAYFEHFGPGRSIGSAIDKYIYVTLHVPNENHVMIHYRRTERVQNVTALLHDRIREGLLSHGIDRQIEVASLSEVPGNTGLGSSSAFTVGLLHALHVHRHDSGGLTSTNAGLWKHGLAQEAVRLEQIACGDTIGNQDQFLTSLGRTNLLTFEKQGTYTEIVNHHPNLWDHVILLNLGITERPGAAQLLQGMVNRTTTGTIAEMVRLVHPFATSMLAGDWAVCGEILTTAWEYKKQLPGVTIPRIDDAYQNVMDMGAWGAKVCGAGSGGYLLVLGPSGLIQDLESIWRFGALRILGDRDGTTLIYSSEQQL